MKKILFLIICLTSFFNAFSEEKDLQFKLDSIIKEGDLLYSYERAVWSSTDILMSEKSLKKNYGGYVVSHSNDTIIVTYIDKSQKLRIAKYYFTKANLFTPFRSLNESSDLTRDEQKLLDIKIKIINQLSDKKYEVGFPQGFNPNFILIKEPDAYRLYIIIGTSENGIIPFGNDYLFWADLSGEITSWKKFHSRIIPAQSKVPGGEKVISCVHSHLRTTPYITSTDICTFRLYGKLCGMTEFMVLCTATGKYYKYNLGTNSIKVTNP